MRTLLFLTLVAGCALAADPKKSNPVLGQSDAVDVTAIIYLDRAEMTQALGHELDKNIYLAEVKVRPKGEKKIRIALDDFTLLKTDDGQRTAPFAPSQLAADGGLSLQSQRLSGWAAQGNGPVWGGVGDQRPRQLPGMGPSTAGSSTANPETVTAKETAKKPGEKAPNPLLDLLKAKCLPEVETNEAVSGLLYFPLDGKVRLKHLTLIYKGPGGKMEMVFQR
jgi:hypothetical protein